MRTKESLKVGVVGCGEIAQAHLRIWRKIDKLCVAAVCDANELRAEKTAKTWNIHAYYSDLGEMLEKESILIVDICTPPQAHCPLIVQALESNCHVIAEKPLTMTTEEAEKIAFAQKGSGTKISVVHNNIFAPAMIKALSLIRKGDLGEVINVDVRIVVPPSDPMLCNKDHWCHSSPGGVFGEMLAHPIYILQAILGPLKVRSVHAKKVASYPWVPFDALWVELDADKCSGTIYASYNSVQDAWFIDIYGTKGLIKVNLVNETLVQLKQRHITTLNRGLDSLQQASQLLLSTAQNGVLKLSGRWVCGHEVCLRAFVQSVIDDKAPPVTLEEACDTIEVLEEICKIIDQSG
ncbi:MAG: Gfo/Idh/MocA family protein [Dehalococcoidia bacterium]